MKLMTKLLLILIVFTCLIYANTLQNGYAMDDYAMITENNLVKQGISGIPRILKSLHMSGASSSLKADDYRPLSLVMFAVEYSCFGLNPFPGHLINIIFYAACVVLLFLFIHSLFNEEKPVMAFVAALLFACHPLHTEVVANIKSRDEIMCFFFSFLSMLFFINYARKGKIAQLIVGSFCLFLAILSKETALTFIILIPLVFFFYANESKHRSAYITASTALVFILFFCAWAYAQKGNELNNLLTSKVMPQSFVDLDQFTAKILMLGYHLSLLIAPYPLNFNYSYTRFVCAGFGSIAVWASLAIYLLLAIFGVRRLFRNKKDPWAFAILFYLVTLSLYSNFFFALGQPFANRYAFFPSAGFCIFFALASEKWIVRSVGSDFNVLSKIGPLSILLCILCSFSAITIARNADWKDNFTLVNADISKSPDDYSMQYKAGLELQNKLEQEPDSVKKMELNKASIACFLRSLALNPGYTEAHADIGVAYFKENNFDSAIFHFKKTLDLNPGHYNAATNLATLYYKNQDYANAIKYYRKSVIDYPNSDIGWYNMGVCYARINLPDSSLACMKRVLEIAPGFDSHKAFGNVAILYGMLGNKDSAIKYEQLTQKYFPNFKLKVQ
jgi:tetratricopeptide (TPR) repeat protein